MAEENVGTGDAGTQEAPAFIDSISEGLRSNEAFTGIDSADALAQKHVDLMAQHQEATTKLEGMPTAPETPEGYSQVDPVEGADINEDVVSGFRAKAHELGLSDSAFQEVVKYQLDMVAKLNADIKEQNQAMVEELTKEWGSETDANVAGIQLVVEKFGLKDLLSAPDDTGKAYIMGNRPELMRALNSISKMISVDRMPGGDAGGAGDVRPQTIDGQPMFKYKDMPG